jgi:hypothetical protein
MEGSRQKGLRPDKLAVMVTNIESQRDTELTWGGSTSPSSSEERLTTEHTLTASRKMDIGIHQTFEVTQTTDGYDPDASRRMAREHV